jgi:hypothetical protein
MFQKLSTKDKVAFIVFVISLVIAVITGIVVTATEPGNRQGLPGVIITLVLLGFLLGLLSLNYKKSVYILISVVVLIVVGGVFAPLTGVGGFLDSILALLATFMAPAGLVLAIKEIIDFGLRKSKEGHLPPTQQDANSQEIESVEQTKETISPKERKSASSLSVQKSAMTKGKKATKKCPACGAANSIGQQFCKYCGKSLRASP